MNAPHAHAPPRSGQRSTGERRGWSDLQRKLFLRACSAAGWNDAQRYIAMRHAGCPLDAKAERPSVKHPRNTNGQFEQLMALAEAHAAMRGRDVPRPREHASWRVAADFGRRRLEGVARAIIAEASTRIPEVFDAGLERYIVEHTTASDDGALAGVRDPATLAECDGGQLHRVVEALRAYAGREFARRGLSPRNFTIPPGALRRAESLRAPSASRGGGDPPTAA